MRLTTESQVLLAAVKNAGGELTLDEDSRAYSEEAIGEAAGAGLLRVSDGSGWSTTMTLSLTKAGKRYCGIPVPPSIASRVKSWLLGTH